ncbi:hypothetical protein BRADI_1g23110v3 [Brachypodium distachyon]|uniref:Glycosyltransferase n=1 Tax=Brachypodium distachyon TaxID=15368 RepID=A0A0Q3NE22_BRADI|nr:hypothetical protein BRADI_1g23110v3 [Brachypodium distachyon]
MAKPTVVLLPVWGAGHFMPMIELGKRMLRCSDGALSLTVLLMPAPTAQAVSDIAEHVRREESADIRFHHLPSVPLPADHTGVEEFISRIVESHVPHVMSAVSALSCPVAALVVDIFCTPAFDVSSALAVPAYVYFASGAAMLALLLRSPSLHEETEAEFFDDSAVLDVPGLPPVPPSFLPATMLDRKKSTYTWFVYTGRRYTEASGFIVNTAAELEPGVLAAIAPTVYPIGPAISFPAAAENNPQPHECIRWLDAQPRASVLLLCFGSKGILSTRQVHEIAHGLARSGHRFLWVLRGLPLDATQGAREARDADLDERLPDGFLEKTKGIGLVWPKRAPQKEILAHASVGGFVTHCGWNSVLESLWFGVPMLPWPLDADQHLNAFTLVYDMGVAVPLEMGGRQEPYVEAAELERSVRSLMGGGEEGRKAREKAMGMKALCRKAVEQNGSSYVSLKRLSEDVLRGAIQFE